VDFERRQMEFAMAAATARLLSPGEVANWLGVSSGWVRDHATRKDPRIRVVRVGKLLRFRPEDVEAFIETAAACGAHPGGTT
jgi:excisionase family DNA binding protein